MTNREAKELARECSALLTWVGERWKVAGAVRCGHQQVNSVIIVTTAAPELVDALFSGVISRKPRIPHTGRLNLTLPVYLVSTGNESWGAKLLWYTGPVGYRKCLCTEARTQNLKLNSSGLWKGKELIAGRTERQILDCLGLPYKHPGERRHFTTTRRIIQNGPIEPQK